MVRLQCRRLKPLVWAFHLGLKTRGYQPYRVSLVWQTGDYSFRHLVEQQRMIHPRTILTRNWAMQQTKEQHRTQRVSASDRITA